MNSKIAAARLPAIVGTILLIGSMLAYPGDLPGDLREYDAVVAAPNNHHVILDNEKVRVLEVVIKPGEREPFHAHPMPSVMIIISGAKLRITEATVESEKLVSGNLLKWVRKISSRLRCGCLPKPFIWLRTLVQRPFVRIALN